MTMLAIFRETVKEIPAKLNILSVKERNSKYVVRVEYAGHETTADLNKTCTPGKERDYCWNVAATAVSTIYFCAGQYDLAKLWTTAINTHDKSLVAPANS